MVRIDRDDQAVINYSLRELHTRLPSCQQYISCFLQGHVWTDNGPVRYTNWDFGQPDSYNGLDACVAMNPYTGFWSDRDCYEKQNVVCKKPRRMSCLPIFCFKKLYYFGT